MPRVHEMKSQGRAEGGTMRCVSCPTPIVKGEEYYQWSIKATRGGTTYRQHKAHGYPKQSQLTNSKLSEAYAAIETAQTDLAAASTKQEIEDVLQACADGIDGVRDEYQNSLDNMPDGLQTGTTGQEIQEKIDALEEFSSNLTSVDLDDDEYEEAAKEAGRTVDESTGEIDTSDLEPDNLEDNRSRADDALNEFSL